MLPKPPSEPTLIDHVHAAFHRSDTRAYAVTQTVVYALIVLSIGLLVLEPFLHGRGETAVYVIDRAILVIFGVELVLRVATFHPRALDIFASEPVGRLRMHVLGRLRYLLHPLQLIDLITVLALAPELRGLRALRALRLLRGVRIFRYHNPFTSVIQAFSQNSLLFTTAFTFLGVVTTLGGTSIYLVEGAHNPYINSIGDGMWWALVTLTTVGFGDITPGTTLGRFVGGGVMVAGMFTLALFAGVVSSSLLNAVLSIRAEQFRMSSHVNHIVVCGYDSSTPMLLETLSQEIDPNQTPVVVFDSGSRPEGVPQPFHWVQGDPTKESELDKVRIALAAAVIVAGGRETSPSQSDANAILTTFTIRSYMKKHPNAPKRKRDVYIVTEILDPENVEHAKRAGADEVIQTRRLGFSMLAHAVTNPGTADTLSSVVIAGAHNIYVGRIPGLSEPTPFGEVMDRVDLHSKGGLCLGFHTPEGKEILNPEPTQTVPVGSTLIYLARKPLLELP